MFHLGIIGYPLTHSLSPQLHTAALQALRLEGDYKLFPVPPLPDGAESLQAIFAKIRKGELNGLNVTIPHKQSVILFMDELTPVAGAVGAVNTVIYEGNRLVGENTDVPGFSYDLGRFLTSVGNQMVKSRADPPSHALILGAGGAARAIAYILDRNGWQVTLAARKSERAQELVKSMELTTAIKHEIRVINLDGPSINQIQSKIGLIVNTTPVGMAPNVDANPWPIGSAFPEGALVYDLIYNPHETALLRAAREANLFTWNGLGMLVEQAALSFESWTGHPAPRRVMAQAAVGRPIKL